MSTLLPDSVWAPEEKKPPSKRFRIFSASGIQYSQGVPYLSSSHLAAAAPAGERTKFFSTSLIFFRDSMSVPAPQQIISPYPIEAADRRSDSAEMMPAKSRGEKPQIPAILFLSFESAADPEFFSSVLLSCCKCKAVSRVFSRFVFIKSGERLSVFPSALCKAGKLSSSFPFAARFPGLQNVSRRAR